MPVLPEPAQIVRPAKKKRRRWPWVIVFAVVGLLVLAAAAAVVYFSYLSSRYDQAERIPEKEVFPSVRPVDTNPEAMNILLLGSDARQGTNASMDDIRGQRADTIMLVHLPADRSGAQVVSIMRDNWVEIPGQGENKINAALALGGVPLLVQTVEGIYDVPIDNVAIIDFAGFKGLSEALDGVTLENEIAFSAGGYTYPQGEITVRGEEALRYVRERYSFPDGDYQRVKNQQAFIKGLVGKLISSDTLTNPVRIADTVNALSPYLSVDAGLDAQTVAGIGLELRSLRADDIVFLTSPTLGTSTADGQSIVLPDWTGIGELSAALQNDTVPEYAAAQSPPAG